MRFFLLFCTISVSAVALANRDASSVAEPESFKNGVVVCVSAAASDVGRATLEQGGTAVDAAVATAFALAVTFPAAGNIGGGGFLISHPGKDGAPTFYDFRETAPAAATREMFVKREDRTAHRLVGVPGTVAGLALAHKKQGKLPWKDLVLPAVALARDGFALDAFNASSLNDLVRRARRPEHAELRRVFSKPDGTPWKTGDKLVQPDLARSLSAIAEAGPDGFYKGKVAELLVAEMKRGSGLISADDLAGYKAVERTPIHGTYRGYDIYAPSPPSSGGVALVEMLNILENFDLKKQDRWSAETLHLMTEAMRRAYCDRARFLGDPDFVKVPANLTTKEYAKTLAETIDLKKATRSEDLAKDIPLTGEGQDTTHLSVIDREGRAVSLTYTLESLYGGRIVVAGAGFLLNDEMNDFNWQPGVTTRTGTIGTEPNVVAPGKRMLSSMTPTIVAKGGKVFLVTGSPGGRTIINTVLNVVVDVLDYDMPLRAAIDAPRMHLAWFPDQLQVEPALRTEHAASIKRLEEMGHKIKEERKQGDAHSIVVDPKTERYIGAEDRRQSGKVSGY